MKKNFKLIISAVLLVAVVAGSAALYNNLVKQYSGDNLVDLGSGEDKPQGNTSQIENNQSSEKEEQVSTESNGDNNTADSENHGNSQGNNENSDSSEETQEPEKPKYNKAPSFTVFDENGNEVSLSDYKGKPVVINFWATWCYYCKEEMPDFNEAYKKYPEVQFLMINATDGVSETVESAKAFVEQHGYEFDIFFDTEYDAINTYGITGYPTTFFIDAEGNLVARGNGMLSLATLEKGIAMILPEEE